MKEEKVKFSSMQDRQRQYNRTHKESHNSKPFKYDDDCFDPSELKKMFKSLNKPSQSNR